MDTEETVRFQVRIPVALHRELTRLAKEERRSLNSEVIIRLERGIAAAAVAETSPQRTG